MADRYSGDLANLGAWPTPAALLGTGTLTQSWFDDKSIYFGVNGVGWSLSCEVLFYAVFPALVLVVRRLTRGGMVCVSGGCVAVLAGLDLAGLLVARGGAGDPAGSAFWWVSVLPVSRLPEFLLGMVAARAVLLGVMAAVRVRRAAVGTLVAACVAGLFPAAAVAGAVTAVPFAVLICAAAQADLSGAPGVQAAKWWVRLGTWSYSFYLTHQLVIRLSASLWPATGLLWLHLLADAVVAVAVSAALYRVVEQPAERRWRGYPDADGPDVPAVSREQTVRLLP